jgi:hypothetical protein
MELVEQRVKLPRAISVASSLADRKTEAKEERVVCAQSQRCAAAG